MQGNKKCDSSHVSRIFEWQRDPFSFFVLLPVSGRPLFLLSSLIPYSNRSRWFENRVRVFFRGTRRFVYARALFFLGSNSCVRVCVRINVPLALPLSLYPSLLSPFCFSSKRAKARQRLHCTYFFLLSSLVPRLGQESKKTNGKWEDTQTLLVNGVHGSSLALSLRYIREKCLQETE